MKRIIFMQIFLFLILPYRSFSYSKPEIKMSNPPKHISVNSEVSSNIRSADGTDNGTVKTVLQGSGANSTSGNAPQGSRRFIKFCYLIKPSEMSYSQFGTDTITSVGWTWIALAAQNIVTAGNIKVYIQNTTDTIYGKGTNFLIALTGMTKIIDNSISIPAGEGAYNIDVTAGGPGTGSFTASAGYGVYIAVEYSTLGILATPLGSPTVTCNDSLSNSIGIYTSQIIDGNILTMSGLRPETRFGDSNKDTVEVRNIYTMGKIPFPWGFPDSLGILLDEGAPHGSNEINVQSVNRDNSQIIFDTTFSSSPEQSFLKLRFPDIFYPQNDLVIVKAIPGDVYDHQIQNCHEITPDAYNYANQCIPDDGGLGFTGLNGRFVAGFWNYSIQQFPIDAIDHCFINAPGKGNQPYSIVIYADNGTGKPGVLMYISPVLFTPPGNNNFQKVTHFLAASVIIPPVSKFYVGYRQSQNVNLSACYQNEIPVRSKTFFYATPDTSTNWIDFVHDSAFYRMDISPRTCKNLKLKVFLEGFFNGSYMIKDKAIVQVRNFYTPFNLISQDTSYLDSNGTGYFNFPQVNNSSDYFFVLKHRNHIETWSKNSPERIDSCNKFYNFTDSLSKAFGNNMKYISAYAGARSASGAFVIYGGDVNQDGIVDGADVSTISNDGNNFVTGYVNTDANGDGVVDASDESIADNNSYNFVSKITP